MTVILGIKQERTRVENKVGQQEETGKTIKEDNRRQNETPEKKSLEHRYIYFGSLSKV